MTTLFSTKYTVALAVAAGAIGFASATECDEVAAAVKKAVSDKPTKVLVIVDEAMSKSESCACEIVKAAISASDADPALVREIVVTAVSVAQGMAATIAECAVAEAPEAASEIKAGLSEVFAGAKGGGKSVIYEDDHSAKGAKEVVVEVEEEEENDFGPERVVFSGVYLISPSTSGSGGSSFRDRHGNLIDQAEIDRQNRLIEILRRRVNRGRDSDRGGATSSGPDPTETSPK